MLPHKNEKKESKITKKTSFMFGSFHFGNFLFSYFGYLRWPESSSTFVYFFKSSFFARLDGNFKNKQMEHIVKKITQLKWPKYKKTKLPKWNEPDIEL